MDVEDCSGVLIAIYNSTLMFQNRRVRPRQALIHMPRGKYGRLLRDGQPEVTRTTADEEKRA